MPNIYEQTQKARDNLILAAIKAENSYMKAVWIHKAKSMELKLNILKGYPADEIINGIEE